jgi:hypothetical protein|tara:strand:+ start:1237 stop:1461 length:225 start_codon:yes stop_codon:yes gene_type:complete
MTKNDFDPRNLGLYAEPKQLLHFQWQDDTRVYRYALVEIIEEKDINSRTKQKKDELELTQEDIWRKYGISSRHL